MKSANMIQDYCTAQFMCFFFISHKTHPPPTNQLGKHNRLTFEWFNARWEQWFQMKIWDFVYFLASEECNSYTTMHVAHSGWKQVWKPTPESLKRSICQVRIPTSSQNICFCLKINWLPLKIYWLLWNRVEKKTWSRKMGSIICWLPETEPPVAL